MRKICLILCAMAISNCTQAHESQPLQPAAACAFVPAWTVQEQEALADELETWKIDKLPHVWRALDEYKRMRAQMKACK